jgi:glycosyltransferase involved in cell wall biosynthesis
MKILFITSELPYPIHKNGISLINYRLLTKSPKGVDIDLLCTDHNSEQHVQMLKKNAPAVRNICCVKKTKTRLGKLLNLVFVYFFGCAVARNQHLRKALARLLKGNRYDVVYACPLTMISELTRVKNLPPIFLNAVDSYSKLCESFYVGRKSIKNRLKVCLYKSYEKKLLLRVSCVNFVSPVDAVHVRSFTQHQNVKSITLGVDDSMFFQQPGVKKEVGNLLFSGNFEYKPNSDTAKYIVEALFPAVSAASPNAKLYIVGKNPPPLKACKNVIVTGFVENIAAWYSKCEIFICPLLYGAGVKNKVLEAMACGIPVISSTVGVSGIEGLLSGTHFLLADGKEEQLAAIAQLFDDAELQEKLALNALAFVKENYNWDRNISMYFEEFSRLRK